MTLASPTAVIVSGLSEKQSLRTRGRIIASGAGAASAVLAGAVTKRTTGSTLASLGLAAAAAGAAWLVARGNSSDNEERGHIDTGIEAVGGWGNIDAGMFNSPIGQEAGMGGTVLRMQYLAMEAYGMSIEELQRAWELGRAGFCGSVDQLVAAVRDSASQAGCGSCQPVHVA